MTIGPVLEVLIGLIFMFFVFSVLSSGINEYISRAIQKRVDFLAAGVSQLLTTADSRSDRTGEKRRTKEEKDQEEHYLKEFWNHPLVKQLGQSLEDLQLKGWRKTWRNLAEGFNRFAERHFVSQVGKAAQLRRRRAEHLAQTKRDKIRRLPSYIPTATFVAVLDDITKADPPAEGTTLKRSLNALHDLDPAQRLANYGRWFDDQMDRVSGWYKQESKSILFVIGLIIVIGMNVDTIAVARTLWRDPTARALVSDAVQAQLEATQTTSTTGAPGASSPTTAVPSIALKVVCKKTAAVSADGTTTTTSAQDAIRGTLECATQLPVGWRLGDACFSRSEAAPQPCSGPVDRVADIVINVWRHPLNALLKGLGLLITACALSFGAPFWFEFLNKFANLRGAGAKPATSTPEKPK